MTDIITNHAPRPIVYGYELTETERAEFDWLDSDELETSEFVRYRGQVYCLSEFMRAPDSFRLIGWQGIATDTYFSATLLKYGADCETVIMGRAYS